MSRLRTAVSISLVMTVILVIPVVVLFTAPMTYSGLIERIVRSATGLQARFADLEVDAFPPRIVTRHLEIRNPGEESGQPLLSVDHFSAVADAGRFLDQSTDWWRAEASGAVFRLALHDNGCSNRDRPVDGNRTSKPQQKHVYTKPLLSFESIEITDFDLLRISESQTHRFHVSSLSLEKDADERLHVSLDAGYQDQPLTASGTLALPDSEHARKVEFQASVFGSELHIKGTVGHDGITPGKVHITANARDLSTLGLLLGQDLSAYAPLTLSGTLRAPEPGRWMMTARGESGGHAFDFSADTKIADQRYELDKLAVDAGNIRLTANGAADIAGRSIKADISASHLDIGQWPFTGFDPGGRRATAGLSRSTSGGPVNLDFLKQWTIDTELRAAEVRYQKYQLKGLRLDARTDADALKLDARIEALAAAADSTPPWQLDKPLRIEVTLNPAPAGNADAGTLIGQIGSGGLDAEFQVTLPAGAGQPISASLQASLENFSALYGVDTKRWDTLLPLALTLQARVTPSRWQLDQVIISVSGNTMEGNLDIDRSTRPLRLSGELHGTALDLNQIPITSAKTIEDTGKHTEEDSGELIGNQPIDWSWLEAVDMDTRMRLERLTVNQTIFNHVRTRMVLHNGQLAIDPIDADLEKGGVRGHVSVRKSGAGAGIDTRLIVTELVPADLGQPDKGLIDGGETDLYLDLRTHGATPHELARALNGEIALEVQHAMIRNDLIEHIGSDILMQTINLINPFAQQDDHTELECAAAHFDAVDGVLTSPDQIVIETSKIKIRGGGVIDLGKETLQIDLVPSARQGVGIGAGDLASVVRLGGTLGNPQPVADPEGILKTGATIGAAIATSGVSLLAQGLFNRLRNTGTACGRIFENTTNVPEKIQKSGPVNDTRK